MAGAVSGVVLTLVLGAVLALGMLPGESVARGIRGEHRLPGTGVLRLPDRSISVTATTLRAGKSRSGGLADLAVVARNLGRRPLTLAATDFIVSIDGDMFGLEGWNVRRSRVTIAPKHSRTFHLRFLVPRGAEQRWALFYRPANSREAGVIALKGSRLLAPRAASTSTASAPTIKTYSLTNGVGDPWGTATDASGNIWFAEPGCDFAPTCASSTPSGQIGELNASSGAVKFYTLPNIAGNQPIFLTFDGSGKLWFTTPNNSMIGEFDPSSGAFLGQWPVTAGSGPWDLTFAGGKIWYTEHFVSAVGSFDPSTHAVHDYQTPSANSLPYGIAAAGQSVWFTENNSSVDRVAVLNPTSGAISEYPIIQPLTNSTPHLIAIDASGHPWWTEGWSNTIATLNPAAATPGTCRTTSGTCNGISRFQVPSSTTCGTSTHVSGIAYQSSTGLVWLDNSLTNQVGSFNPTTSSFAMSNVSCGVHPHDGLNIDPSGNVWFDEEFANALGEVISPSGSGSSGQVSIAVSPNPPVSGSLATFTASDTDPSGIASVQWTFGDGTSATGNPVSHTYSASGTETLTAVVTDNDGNKDQLTQTISVAPPPSTPPSGTVASDSFTRTVSNGWGTADTGGAWTPLDGTSSWSVNPGVGSINVAAGAEQRGILSTVSAQDVDLLAKIVVPRCSDTGTNCDAYLLGRVSGGSSPSYYRVGVVQGQGRNTVFIRAQRSDGSYLANDVDTGIPAAAGVTVWLRVEFQGVNPTTIRARAWLAGATEPTSWLLNTTDSTSAEQAAGAVGVRARNEDSSAGHTFDYENFLATALASTPPPPPPPPPSGTAASDSFQRTVASGWGNADQGGWWTVVGSPWNWSVAPGAGSVSVAASAQELGYLSSFTTQDVDVLEQLVLPRCTDGGNNCDAYILGRYSPAYNPTYYRVGLVQGAGRPDIFIRAQLSDGSNLASDVDTHLPAANGAKVLLRVEFTGVNPTTIRARAWLAGTTEPTTWPLNITDGTTADQKAGMVGVRFRNEDSTAAHTFQVQSYQVAGTPTPVTNTANPSTTAHWLYAVTDGTVYVYDIDNNNALVKRFSIPAAGKRGVAVAPSRGLLYITECGTGNCAGKNGSLLAYDLVHDVVAWIANYSFGVDQPAVTPDGSTIYMPHGADASDGAYSVLDASDGKPIGSIATGTNGHNTIVSLDGTQVYLTGFTGTNSNFAHVVDTSTGQVALNAGPTINGVRPFTVNGSHTLMFTTSTSTCGFQVISLTTGQVLYTIPFGGSCSWSASTAPSHGISLSPDEKRLYVMDAALDQVEVYDVSGLPGTAPTAVASIPISSLSGTEQPCQTDCEREGWLLNDLSGRYVYVGDTGDVIDTSTNTVVANRAAVQDTRQVIEVDWANGTTSATSTRFGLGHG